MVAMAAVVAVAAMAGVSHKGMVWEVGTVSQATAVEPTATWASNIKGGGGLCVV